MKFSNYNVPRGSDWEQRRVFSEYSSPIVKPAMYIGSPEAPRLKVIGDLSITLFLPDRQMQPIPAACYRLHTGDDVKPRATESGL